MRLDPLLRPRSVAILGVSAKRAAIGNTVLANLAAGGFDGRVIPIHPDAPVIGGHAAVRAIEDLPEGMDIIVLAVPAASVPDAIRRAGAAGVRAALVIAKGFSAEAAAALQQAVAATGMVVHGPASLGYLNLTDRTVLFTGSSTARVRPGRVALVAQPGSGAVAILGSTDCGFSKIVTVGTGCALDAGDYLGWLAGDRATDVIGLVADRLGDPENLAAATGAIAAAGKSVAILPVGPARPEIIAWCRGARVPVAGDYDELTATLEAFAVARWQGFGRGRLAVVGTSGGEAVLACDLAGELGLALAAFDAGLAARLRVLLPGSPPVNPLDIGATVMDARQRPYADCFAAILESDGVDGLLIVQDAQASLSEKTVEHYRPLFEAVVRVAGASAKPVVIASPTAEAIHLGILSMLDGAVPLLRGLRHALIAVRNMAAWTEG